MGRRAEELALALVLAALVVSTVWFGATSPATLAAVGIAIYAAGMLLLLGRPDLLSVHHRTALDLPIAALVGLALVQLLPLPAPLHRVLSPGFAGLRDSLGPGSPALVPLSAYPYATVQALGRLAAAAAVFFIISRAIVRPARLRIALLALVCLGVAEAAYGMLGYLLDSPTILAGHPQHYPGSATGTLVCKNHFAGLMEMLIPASLAYYCAFSPRPDPSHPREQNARRALLLAPAVIMALALAFSRSRAGIVCFAFSLAVTFTLARRGRRQAYSRLAVASLAAAFLIYGNAIGFDPVIESFQSLDKDYAMSRLEIWRDGVQLAALSPILGSGAGTWASLFPVVKSTPVQLTFSHAHNDYVQALAEGGVVGLGILLWILVAAYRQVRSALDDPARSSSQRLLLLALATGILSIALHGLVDFNLQIPSNLFLFMTLLGLLAVAAREPAIVGERKEAAGARRTANRRSHRGPTAHQ